jgi:hypothetical protein
MIGPGAAPCAEKQGRAGDRAARKKPNDPAEGFIMHPVVRPTIRRGAFCLAVAGLSLIAAGCSGTSGTPVAPIKSGAGSPTPVPSVPPATPSPSPTPTLAALTYIAIPADSSIQTDLINTFPTGIFTAQNALGTTFSIPSSPATCGYAANGPCNFYQGFGSSGSGETLTINVSIANVGHVYSLMNAYDPGATQLATIEFIGSAGATATFPLIGGEVIRDFYQGNFVNSLTNGVPNVMALNAFTCVDPTNCIGGGGTGDVNTGATGTYVIDEQAYTLPAAFQTQNLLQIVITDTHNGSNPILLGLTAGP